jgi:hypothetical protein
MNASICWVAGTSFFSHMIRRMDPSRINHVLYRFRTDDGMDVIYESLGKTGITLSPARHLESALADGRVYEYHEHDLALGHSGSAALWDACTRMHGLGYDWRQIALYIGMLRWGRDKAVNTRNDPKRYTCNEFIIDAGRGIIPTLDGADYRHTPEGLFRLFWGRPSLAS